MGTQNCRHRGFSVRRSPTTGVVRGDFVDYPLGVVRATGVIAVHLDGTVDYSAFNVQRGVMGALNSGSEPWVVQARQEAVDLINAHS